jgi:arginine decarboxylase|tara:strand:+ start:31642 stop:34326 length:2685 start_codon:yes stop_codon:yes gene_type:complete
LKNAAARLMVAERRDPGSPMHKVVEDLLHKLEPIESYWAFPGRVTFERLHTMFEEQEFTTLTHTVARITRALMSDSYRSRHIHVIPTEDDEDNDERSDTAEERARNRPYFEVMIVDDLSPHQETTLKRSLRDKRRAEDSFVYESVVVGSFEDALIGVLFNHNIQAVVVRYGFPYKSRHDLPMLKRYLNRLGDETFDDLPPEEYGVNLAYAIGKLRPELDIYMVTDQSVEDIAGRVCDNCRRVFYNQEDYMELHLNILRGVNTRYKTPFFTALKEYSKQPTGVFHAMPISRGKSIAKSHWIKDMGDFYGMNIFLAETSATSGGLDSLLDPHGPIKHAQESAARAFGARHTFFATNGTSTCNKIVVQALVKPDDIVLVDRDCHKSHHYGMVLAGAQVVYLDSYPLNEFSMYGAVPLREIKHQLLKLKKAGKLDRVKMLLLTNCTFDGLVYNVERVMEECLAIKPDLVFLWDEAWFAFARFGPTYRQRTAMHNAAMLRERYQTGEYREQYEAWKAAFDKAGPEKESTWLDQRLMPDPDKVRVRVYACQSTHKTLTSLRQGSMIHIHDQDYKSKAEESFHEAYMTHTSTSPNYQIVASLDVGRRQVELEGFEMVQKQVEMAMVLREKVATHPLLSKYFRVLTASDMIPAEYRESGMESYYQVGHGWADIWEAWAKDEFALDATRVTLLIGKTGLDGDTFKNKELMDKYGIQINKTSRNTVLFMTNIGTTRSSVAYLIEVLVKISAELDERLDDSSPVERALHNRQVTSLLEELPPQPDFSRFHDSFRAKNTQKGQSADTAEGDIRTAYFLAYDQENCEYLSLEDGSLDAEMAKGREIVSSTFIIPYPPGFPILVPGQVLSIEILKYMRALDVKEIHGYRPELGLRVFTEKALKDVAKK